MSYGDLRKGCFLGFQSLDVSYTMSDATIMCDVRGHSCSTQIEMCDHVIWVQGLLSDGQHTVAYLGVRMPCSQPIFESPQLHESEDDLRPVNSTWRNRSIALRGRGELCTGKSELAYRSHRSHGVT